MRHAIYVAHGQPLVFGEHGEFGLVQQGFGLKVVRIGQDGVQLSDILVHDAHCSDNTLQLKLAMMSVANGFPVALGVIRDVQAPTYEERVWAQIAEQRAAQPYHNFEQLLETNDIWEIR